MTIRKLKEKIESWPETTMPFCVEDVFSWRGIWKEPACSISTDVVSKERNIEMLNLLLTDEFQAWKGGTYRYNEWQDIHFETGASGWSDGKFIMNFLLDNADNEAVRHIFHSEL